MADMKPSSAGVKGERRSWEEERSTSTSQLTAGIMEELRSDNTGNTATQIKVEPTEDEDPPQDTHSLFLTNHIKEEPCDYEGELRPSRDQSLGNGCEDRFPGGGGPPLNFTPYTPSLCIKEESGDDGLEEELEYTTVCIKEEPISGDEGDFPPADVGERRTSGVLPDGSALGGGEESDSLSDHTEIEYTTVRIKGEESSDEDYVEVVSDIDNYATRDHTYMVTRTDDRMRAPCNIRKLHKTLNCSECGKVFFGKAAYRLHQRLHRGEAIYTCSTCGKKFSRKGSCLKHQEAAHSREKSFECANCDRYFSSKLGLTLHQRVHTREPAFTCKDCTKSFTSNSALIQHQRVHYTDRRLVCAKCGVTFDNKSDLINHEILHPVQQSFVCSECSEKFQTKAELCTHWKVHTVIKAFSWRKIHFKHKDTCDSEVTVPGAAGGQ